jgi:dihydroflavonol-4-reductase
MSSIVMVTGASGHIGSHIVRQLVAQGRRVRAVYMGQDETLSGLDVERVQADITDPGALSRAMNGVEIVYHLAAVISLDPWDEPLMRRVNVDGVRNVTRVCLTHGVKRLVHFISIHAFASRAGVVDETAPLVENGPPAYDRSKAAGTRIVREAMTRGLDTVVIHPTGVIGPLDQRPSLMGSVMISLARRTLPAMVRGGFNWVDVRDVASTALSAETQGRSGEHYIVSGRWAEAVEIAQLVERYSGARAPRSVVPLWMAHASLPLVSAACWLTRTRSPYNRASLHALSNHRQVSHEKAARELGHEPRPLEQTIADSVAWFRQAGLISA